MLGHIISNEEENEYEEFKVEVSVLLKKINPTFSVILTKAHLSDSIRKTEPEITTMPHKID